MFSFMNHAFVVKFKNSLLHTRLWRFSHTFFPKSFMVLCSSSLWPISSSFLFKMWDLGQVSFPFLFFFGLWISTRSSTICWKSCLSSIELNCFCTFVENQWGIFVWIYFWALYSFHWSMCLSLQYHSDVIVVAIQVLK